MVASASVKPTARLALAIYCLLSAAFWLWLIWPWLTYQDQSLTSRLAPIFPAALYVCLSAALIATAVLIFVESRLAIATTFVVAIFHGAGFVALLINGASGQVSAVRCIFWLLIAQMLSKSLQNAEQKG
jgi:hypothetical protein